MARRISWVVRGWKGGGDRSEEVVSTMVSCPGRTFAGLRGMENGLQAVAAWRGRGGAVGIGEASSPSLSSLVSLS